MALAAIACVRNEADIVEVFVRHTLAVCDRLMVLDNGSTDSTSAILAELVSEGLPVEVLDDPRLGYRQAEQMTRLARLAAEDPAVDWVVPLDADEFVVVEGHGSFGAALADHDTPVFLPWRTYCPHEIDDPDELNVLARIRMRRAVEPRAWTKVVVPASLAGRAFLEPGSHNVIVDGLSRQWPVLSGAWLAHFPIRSPAQWVVKTAIGAYGWMLIGDDYHYAEAYRSLQHDWESFMAGFRESARRYGLKPGDPIDFELVEDPLPYLGSDLKYTEPTRPGEPWRSLLEYGAEIARSYAELTGVRSKEPPGQGGPSQVTGDEERRASSTSAPSQAGHLQPDAGTEVTADEAFERAVLAMKARDWEASKRLWAAVFEICGDDTPEPAYPSLGRVHRKLGDLDRALAVVDAGMERFPGSGALAMERAEIAMAAKEWSEAAVLWQRALGLLGDAFPSSAHAFLARCLRRAGDLDHALRVVEEGMSRFPEDPVLSAERAALARLWPMIGEAGVAVEAGGTVKGGEVVATSPEGRLIEALDATRAGLEANASLMARFRAQRNVKLNDVVWLLPRFSHVYWGGVYTTLRLADYCSRVDGTRNHIALIGRGSRSLDDLRRQVRDAFPKMDFDLAELPAPGDVARLPAADIGVCTLWSSAYYLLEYTRCRGKFYFVQDFEPLFSAGGAVSGLIEQTYRFGFAGIANSPGVAEAYRAYGNETHCLMPAIDPTVFHPRARRREDDVVRIVFYGRPSRPRNGFELGASALRRVKERFGAGVEIVSVGERFREADHGLEDTLTNLGVLPGLSEVAGLYRESDIGLVFMFTKHPSYQPLEYMASGCATVTNVNEATSWLFRDGVNARLTIPTVSGVVDAISELVEEPSLRARVVEGGLATAKLHDWETELALAHRFMTKGQSRDR